MILTTPPTRNHCFNHPKHLRNSSDFVPKSNLESGDPQNTEFSPFQTPVIKIVTPNGEKGNPTGSRKWQTSHQIPYMGPPGNNLLSRCPTMVSSDPNIMPTGPKKIPTWSQHEVNTMTKRMNRATQLSSNSTPVNQTPVHQTPVNQTPISRKRGPAAGA